MSHNDNPHRRYNPLTNEWILVSPHRTKRPWQGQTENTNTNHCNAYDESCYLCPSNTRQNGEKNPNYLDTFVFNNDFAALTTGNQIQQSNEDDLFINDSINGECRVICFSAKHNLTLAQMDESDIIKVIELWQTQYQELKAKYKWVQIFENKGAVMGCSNPHPHGQIWASDFIPSIVEKEQDNQQKYHAKHNASLLLSYALSESKKQQRVIAENADFIVVVPYWATWPFETLLLPKFAIAELSELTTSQKTNLAQAMKTLLVKYDNLFKVSFPYSLGWHSAPEKQDSAYFQLHAHFYPPLLRSATVKKFMVGYEMFAESQRDITPELAAQMLNNTTR